MQKNQQKKKSENQSDNISYEQKIRQIQLESKPVELHIRITTKLYQKAMNHCHQCNLDSSDFFETIIKKAIENLSDN